jgi:hypothetical protein
VSRPASSSTGHGNNEDGVDDDNPGRGGGGPNAHKNDGGIDDDEGSRGNQYEDAGQEPGGKPDIDPDDIAAALEDAEQNGEYMQDDPAAGDDDMDAHLDPGVSGNIDDDQDDWLADDAGDGEMADDDVFGGDDDDGGGDQGGDADMDAPAPLVNNGGGASEDHFSGPDNHHR